MWGTSNFMKISKWDYVEGLLSTGPNPSSFFFVLPLNSKFHTNFNIFYPVDLASHLLFVETAYISLSRFFAKDLS